MSPIESTNTLIIRGFTSDEINDEEMIQQLQNQIIANTPSTETIKFSILKSFKRIIIVFESIESSQSLYTIMKTSGFKVGFSSTNNYDDFILTKDGYKFDTRDFLHLPSHGTTYIISPPPSPPPGWISRPEEQPDNRAIYSPEELKELLYQRVDEKKLLNLNTKEVFEQKVLLDTQMPGSPIIVLEGDFESDEHGDDHSNEASSRLIKPAKVTLPPF